IGLYAASRSQLGGAGSFEFARLVGLHLGTNVERWIFVGFFFAFAVKAPLWPLHTWLPDAAAEAPSGGAVLIVSVMDKVGTFAMLRLCLPLFPAASRWAAPVIIVLALVSLVYGALVAIGQTDLKRLIAYTSVSHFGLIVLGVFVMTSQGQAGSALYMVNHGFTTAALFLIVGFMTTRRGSQMVDSFGGVQKVAPVLAGTFLVAGMSSLALPGLSSFVSEFLVLVGTFTRYPAAGVVATIAIVLAAIYILTMYRRTMTGPTVAATEGMKDLNAREIWVVAPLLAIIVAIGFYPSPLLNVITPSVNRTMSYVHEHDPAPVVTVAARPSEGTGS
ncbi:MAG: NADH-quinone oxidoreductase subunit M, partial [Actinomycetes bacterium]